MARGLGPYAGLGKKKGKETAGNLRLLYPYHLAHYYLIAFAASGIDSWDKLKGKTIFNGPPRGGALNTARALIRLTTGMNEGKGYTGKQIAWGQADSIFLDGAVDAAVRPGTNPAAYLPIYIAAGKINLVSIPKAKMDSAAFRKFLRAPGNVAFVFPKKNLAHYGPGVNVISEDDMFRSISNTGGDVVHKSMPNALARALTAAMIETLPDLFRKGAVRQGPAVRRRRRQADGHVQRRRQVPSRRRRGLGGRRPQAPGLRQAVGVVARRDRHGPAPNVTSPSAEGEVAERSEVDGGAVDDR